MKVRVAILSLFTLITGCAFGTRGVNLTYGERVTTQVAPSGTRGRLAIAQFSDGRPDDERERLGRIRNLYGIPTASVVAEQNPVLWVSDGIARALEARGYQVSRVRSSVDAKGSPVLSGVVKKVYSGMYMGMEADIAADVEIMHSQAKVASTQCSGKATKTAWTGSASEFEAVFQDAMDAFINDCVPRLVEPIDHAISR